MQANMSVVQISKDKKDIKGSVVVGVVKKSIIKKKKNIKSIHCCGNLRGSMKMFGGSTTMFLQSRTM